ncbi:MAG: hypothetical protein P4L47_06345 [Mucilaginibacter sp.]|nr:hypothetical protein [Mucilaginibacter sp.]
MAFTFYPAVAIFAVLVNMGFGNFYYTQFIVPSIRTQNSNPSTKKSNFA